MTVAGSLGSPGARGCKLSSRTTDFCTCTMFLASAVLIFLNYRTSGSSSSATAESPDALRGASTFYKPLPGAVAAAPPPPAVAVQQWLQPASGAAAAAATAAPPQAGLASSTLLNYSCTSSAAAGGLPPFFVESLDGKQCMGLRDARKVAGGPTECAEECCAHPECRIWQFLNGNGAFAGCWAGDSNDCKPQAGWVGGRRRKDM